MATDAEQHAEGRRSTPSPTLAGVSIATVSRVLQGSPAVSEKTRGRCSTPSEQLNYVPSGAARSLAVRHHEATAWCCPS